MKFQITAAKVFMPTTELRFVSRTLRYSDNTTETDRILQQAWQDRLTGEIEWRDVPEVQE